MLRGLFILIDNLDALSEKNKGLIISLFTLALIYICAYS